MAETYTEVDRLGIVGLFAPGGYACKCQSCGHDFTGDKRARQCLPCAVSDLQTTVKGLRSWAQREMIRIDEAEGLM